MRFVLAVLVLLGCGCTNAVTGKPVTFGEAVVVVRKVAHDAAKLYCRVHVAATPLLIAAQGAWPPMIIPRTVADRFCDAVAAVERAARETPSLGWIIDPNGFDEIPPTDSGGESP